MLGVLLGLTALIAALCEGLSQALLLRESEITMGDRPRRVRIIIHG